jgi:hypothetical protein
MLFMGGFRPIATQVCSIWSGGVGEPEAAKPISTMLCLLDKSWVKKLQSIFLKDFKRVLVA